MEQEKAEERLIMAYTAGMIDGDGSICLQTKNDWWLPCISVAVSCESLVMFLFSKFGGRITKSRDLPKWEIRRKKEGFDFLNSISDFLIEKREIALATMRGDIAEVKRLNKWTCQEFFPSNALFKSDEESWAYIAGFLDADGHITIKKRLRNSEKRPRNLPDYSVEIGCGGTDFRATNFIYNFFAKGSLKTRPHKFCVNGIRLDYRIRKHDEVKVFIERCMPHLRIKKSNAQVVLEFINGYKTKIGGDDRSVPTEQLQHRESCFQRMKLLQRRK